MPFSIFMKLELKIKLVFDSSAVCWSLGVPAVGKQWQLCCRQRVAAADSPGFQPCSHCCWGWGAAGWGCPAGKQHWLSGSLLAPLHTLCMHICARVPSPRVFGVIPQVSLQHCQHSPALTTDWAPVCCQRQLHCSLIPPTFGIN